jgi:hypothetical protein
VIVGGIEEGVAAQHAAQRHQGAGAGAHEEGADIIRLAPLARRHLDIHPVLVAAEDQIVHIAAAEVGLQGAEGLVEIDIQRLH